ENFQNGHAGLVFVIVFDERQLGRPGIQSLCSLQQQHPAEQRSAILCSGTANALEFPSPLDRSRFMVRRPGSQGLEYQGNSLRTRLTRLRPGGWKDPMVFVAREGALNPTGLETLLISGRAHDSATVRRVESAHMSRSLVG